MLPSICRCCGARIGPDSLNQNLCSACALADLEPSTTANQRTPPCEEFLDPEGPTVLDCFSALQQAEQAIADENASAAAPKPATPSIQKIRHHS